VVDAEGVQVEVHEAERVGAIHRTQPATMREIGEL
jgi:hypothetical protein